MRYGNVIGSRGSVFPRFLARRAEGALPITDPAMTRFNITLAGGIALVIFAIENMWGGEVYVPKIPSYRIVDVARAIAPEARLDIVGVRPGEKLHEEMITSADSRQTLEFTRHYVILPSMPLWDVDDYIAMNGGKRCQPGFSYESSTNTEWLGVEEIRELVRAHVDPTFVAVPGTSGS